MKRTRQILAFVLALVLLSAGVPALAAPRLSGILQKGELVVGTAGDMPPFNMTTKDGKLIGLDVDVASLMAGAMGVKLSLKTVPFGELLVALEAGKVEMVLSQMTITPRRNLQVAFVGPYFISGKAFLTKQETIARAREGSEVDNPRVTLAAIKGSTSQFFVEGVIPKAKLVTTTTYDEAIRLVLDDKVDAMVADYPICAISAFRHLDRGLISVITPVTYEPLGIALPAGDPHLINWVENFLQALEASGQLEALQNRWLGKGDWLKELP